MPELGAYFADSLQMLLHMNYFQTCSAPVGVRYTMRRKGEFFKIVELLYM